MLTARQARTKTAQQKRSQQRQERAYLEALREQFKPKEILEKCKSFVEMATHTQKSSCEVFVEGCTDKRYSSAESRERILSALLGVLNEKVVPKLEKNGYTVNLATGKVRHEGTAGSDWNEPTAGYIEYGAVISLSW